MSNVPSIVFTPNGLTLPTDAEILAGAQADMNAAFGGNLNPALETPQGQQATSLSAIIADKNSQIANVVNQMNPDIASGRFQDAIGRIYYLDRIPAAGTVVQIQCNGLSGTVIPVGAMVQDTSGNQYSATQSGTIGVSGNVTIPFTCTTFGPIPVPSSVSIYKAISGWESASPGSGVEGNLVESRQAFEIRRRASVALNATGSVQAVRAAVLAVSGVVAAYAIDNTTGSPITVGGVTLPANTIYVAAVGGLASDIANAIWTKKSAGCSYYAGNTSVTVYDTAQGSQPYPSYNVTFEVPENVPILFAVQIKASSLLASNINTSIQNAIISAFSGNDGGPPAQIGSTLFASRFYAGVAATDPNCEVVSIQIGTSTANQNYLALNINQYPTISAQNITITQV